MDAPRKMAKQKPPTDEQRWRRRVFSFFCPELLHAQAVETMANLRGAVSEFDRGVRYENRSERIPNFEAG
jgi:hypothetical protein